MAYPNDAEFKNFTERLEQLYQHEAVPPRETRDTWVDPIGYGAWESNYYIRRSRGEDHETATRAIEAEIRAIWHPPPTPAHPGPLVGQLRLKPGVEGCWSDDTGPVTPLFCHHMSAFSQWVHGQQDRVRTQCARIAWAGYHGIRALDVLGYYDSKNGQPAGWFGKEVTPIAFTSISGRAIPATPDYYGQKRAFLEMLHDHGLKLMDDRGDLVAFTREQKYAHMRENGRLYASMGDVGEEVLAGLWACNESWQNGVPDHGEAAQMLVEFGDAGGFLPDTRGLSWGAVDNFAGGADPTGELPVSMKHWSIDRATVITMHGARLNWAAGEHLIAHYLGYSFYDGNLRAYGKRTWNTEPVGGDALGDDEVTNGAIHDPERIAGVHLECLLTGQAATFMSGAGVWGERELDGEPGFQATANLLKWLPKDLHTFRTIVHASRPEAVIKDDKPGQHHTRADWAIHDDGRVVGHVYGDGNPHYAMPFARACSECTVIDVPNNQVTADGPRHPGDRFSDEFRYSRLVIGKLA